MLVDAVTAALAGPLIVAGAAKLLASPGGIDWPVRTGPLRAPWGPRLTGGAEAAMALAIVAVPGRPAALAALLAYLALTAAALGLRGRRCACFGLARLASVGRAHIGLDAVAALVAAVTLAAGPGSEPFTRAVTAAAAAAVTLAAVLLLDRRARRDESAATAAGCDQQVIAVRIYTTDDCPSCRSLKQLLETMEPARRDAVVTVPVGPGEELPGPLSGLGVPCALAVGESGEPVCTPVAGIGAVKALVDGIVIRNARSLPSSGDIRVA
ncbi:hypothetical protein [Actinomadura sp. HBU206391]|uniref:hypothetical protein n=1 Tax=Actinomadura sp. HBU206391 TaxID=2731692 RepID=UPI00164FF8E6|nr:hypothetical protein [Actinomadura sp. HBU206391]MBC6459920.1 hypothetical protein [Actinomadura sp. HBU206391]